MYIEIVVRFSRRGDTIADACGGMATGAIAAGLEGRHAIVVDNDPSQELPAIHRIMQYQEKVQAEHNRILRHKVLRVPYVMNPLNHRFLKPPNVYNPGASCRRRHFDDDEDQLPLNLDSGLQERIKKQDDLTADQLKKLIGTDEFSVPKKRVDDTAAMIKRLMDEEAEELRLKSAKSKKVNLFVPTLLIL